MKSRSAPAEEARSRATDLSVSRPNNPSRRVNHGPAEQRFPLESSESLKKERGEGKEGKEAAASASHESRESKSKGRSLQSWQQQLRCENSQLRCNGTRDGSELPR